MLGLGQLPQEPPEKGKDRQSCRWWEGRTWFILSSEKHLRRPSSVSHMSCHLLSVRGGETKDSLEDRGTQSKSSDLEENRIKKHREAAAEGPIQLHLLDEVTGAHVPVNTMWQAQFKHLTCINAAPQPSRDRYSNDLHFELGEMEIQKVELNSSSHS